MSENVKKEPLATKKLLLPLLAALVGVILLVIGGLGEWDKESAATDAVPVSAELDADAFAAELESRVVAICSRVSGAGEVRAVVTLSGGYRALYATDSRGSDNSYSQELVLTGSGSSEAAILVGYENPEIAGIGIVCTGGNDPAVRAAILRLVSAAFDVGSHKIYVAAA